MSAIETVPQALAAFAREIEAALATITEASPAATNAELSLLFDQATAHHQAPGHRHAFSLREGSRERTKAKAAARAILQAEKDYSKRCLSILASAAAEPAYVIECRAAGDAMLRFGASAFTRLAMDSTDSDMQKLMKLANDAGSCCAGGRASSAPTSAPARFLAPRLSPLG